MKWLKASDEASDVIFELFPNFFTRENPDFVEILTFTLIEGETMKCEVIFPRNEMRGEIVQYCSDQTLF